MTIARCDGCGGRKPKMEIHRTDAGLVRCAYCRGCERLRDRFDVGPCKHQQFRLPEVGRA